MSVHLDLEIVGQFMPPAHLKSVRPPAKSVLKVSEPRRSGMPLKTLIVDDEPIARRVLREELESIDGVEVIGERVAPTLMVCVAGCGIAGDEEGRDLGEGRRGGQD